MRVAFILTCATWSEDEFRSDNRRGNVATFDPALRQMLEQNAALIMRLPDYITSSGFSMLIRRISVRSSTSE
jgi:hypothetical protein